MNFSKNLLDYVLLKDFQAELVLFLCVIVPEIKGLTIATADADLLLRIKLGADRLVVPHMNLRINLNI